MAEKNENENKVSCSVFNEMPGYIINRSCSFICNNLVSYYDPNKNSSFYGTMNGNDTYVVSVSNPFKYHGINKSISNKITSIKVQNERKSLVTCIKWCKLLDRRLFFVARDDGILNVYNSNLKSVAFSYQIKTKNVNAPRMYIYNYILNLFCL